MAKLFVSTPMYGGQCTGFYAQSLIQLNNLIKNSGNDCIMSFMFNESLITRARNALAHNFLKTDCSHLMFIDADIRFNPADIPPMIEADKDIICGVYPKKEINWHGVKAALERGVSVDELKHHTGSFVVNLVEYSGSVTVPINQPVEIWNGGTGFMLIKREVIETIIRRRPALHSQDAIGLDPKFDPYKYALFDTQIDEVTKEYLSEDYYFCKLWRNMGGKIWADLSINLAHMGYYKFQGDPEKLRPHL